MGPDKAQRIITGRLAFLEGQLETNPRAHRASWWRAEIDALRWLLEQANVAVGDDLPRHRQAVVERVIPAMERAFERRQRREVEVVSLAEQTERLITDVWARTGT